VKLRPYWHCLGRETHHATERELSVGYDAELLAFAARLEKDLVKLTLDMIQSLLKYG